MALITDGDTRKKKGKPAVIGHGKKKIARKAVLLLFPGGVVSCVSPQACMEKSPRIKKRHKGWLKLVKSS